MDKEQRILYPDMLRTSAAFAVVMIHIAQLGIAGSSGLFDRQASCIYRTACIWSVPCFFMISGMLFLSPERERPFSKILSGNFVRMCLLFLFWNIFYFAFAGASGTGFNPSLIGRIAIKACSLTFAGNCFFHLWYIPAAAGLYLISPLLKAVLSKMPLKAAGAISAAIFLLSASAPVFQWPAAVTSAIAVLGYVCLFALGSILDRADIKGTMLSSFYIAGILGLACSILIHLGYHGFMTSGLPGSLHIDYVMPGNVLTASAIFLFFKNNADRLKIAPEHKKMITLCSSLTLGIYILHILSIFAIRMVAPEFIAEAPAVTVPAVSIMAFAMSAGAAFALKKIPIFGKYML